MTDYTKSIDWESRDNLGAAINAADHDTELDLIATALATKSEVASAPTVGNLAEQSAAGKLVDSGVASAPFDNVTSNLETQLVDFVDTSAAVANHVRAGNFFLNNGEVAATAFDLGLITEDTWESVGPTGSGADNIWTALDVLPSTARALIVMVNLDVSVIATNLGSYDIYVVTGDDTTPSLSTATLLFRKQQTADGADSAHGSGYRIIPLNSDQVFEAHWAASNLTLGTEELTYKGFVVD